MNILKTSVAGLALLGATAAYAQTTTPAPAAGATTAPTAEQAEPAMDSTAEATGAASADATASATASKYSEAELTAFAKAAMDVTKVEQDATLTAAQRQPKMLEVIQKAGLKPERFNEIAIASQKDAALLQKIQLHAGKVQQQNN